MVGKSLSASILGLDAKIIQIEVDMLPSQLPGLTIVGLPDKAVQEARERIVSAVKNSGFEWPRKRIVVNLAPAGIPKVGSSFDIPIAVAVLAADNMFEYNYQNCIFSGELALDGSVRPITGALSMALEATNLKVENLFLPKENAFEASLIKGVNVFGIQTLSELIEHLQHLNLLSSTQNNWNTKDLKEESSIDFKYIKGQAYVKRAAEIAASGSHNLLLSGTPGSGKTMIAKALPSILPELTFDEALEITRIYSVANLLEEKDTIIYRRPFRSPHHTASTTSIIGGGKFPKPGELSLAHRGILFLDEFPEFSKFTLEALRQPLEDKKVVISRISGTLTFPSSFMLVSAMNPCKCGWKGDPERECSCSPLIAERYKKRISGPVVDRIDLQINVPRVKVDELTKYGSSRDESSQDIRNRVQNSRNIQLKRFKNTLIYSNAEIPQKSIEAYCPMSNEANSLMSLAAQKLNLSARSYYRTIKVSRTIADLECSELIEKRHVAEAIQYRINE